jgi:hypothetical protein
MAATTFAHLMASSPDPVPTNDLSYPLLKKSVTLLAPSTSKLTSTIKSTKEKLATVASDKSDAASPKIHVKSDLINVFNTEKCATQLTATFACMMNKRDYWEELLADICSVDSMHNNAMIELDGKLVLKGIFQL